MKRGMLVKETAEHAIRLFESAAFSSVFFFPDVIFAKDSGYYVMVVSPKTQSQP